MESGTTLSAAANVGNGKKMPLRTAIPPIQ